MTDHNNSDQDSQSLDAAFSALAASERQHRAPATLRATIARDVHLAMRAQAATDESASLLQRTLEWISAHWWRTISLGSVAAVIPLLTGALLGYQLTTADQTLADPANEWLASYSASADSSGEDSAGGLLP